MTHMAYLPVMLQVAGRRCVVVGAGSAAQRRAASLLGAGAAVTVIAPRINRAFATVLRARGATLKQRRYHRGDLRGALLAVIATDDAKVNRAAAGEAGACGVLTNRADQPDDGDCIVPAHARRGPVTLAVYADGIAPAAAATIRRELLGALDPAWPALLETVAPFRAAIQSQFTDPAQRRRRLLAMTGAKARALFKAGGKPALIRHCHGLLAAQSPIATRPRRRLRGRRAHA
jgi:precorrin-2 dehydrogenase/sirohydrochlorin ferrochelatase